MNIKKLKDSIKELKKDLGDALLATDIFTTINGTSIGGFNTQPKACALFNQITTYLKKALSESGFPALGDYYLVNLEDKNVLVFLPLGEYQWSMLINTENTPLGLLLNIVVPKAINAFEEATAA